MTIQLPTLPRSNTHLTLISRGLDLTPTMGGPTQRALRMGDRWKLEVSARSMNHEQGQGYVAQLLQGLSEKVRFRVPQISPAPSDRTVVSGSGRSLTVSGTGLIRAGTFFNIVRGGVHYLHQVTADSTNGVLAILPMLKVVVANGDQVIFQTPQIEGFLEGNQQSWSVSLAETVGLSFSIVEAQ